MKTLVLLLLAGASFAFDAQAVPQEAQEPDRSPFHRSRERVGQPADNRINSGQGGGHHGDHGQNGKTTNTARFPQELRSIDGLGNNLLTPWWGAADFTMLRLVAADYEDGLGAPSGSDRPSARSVSNLVVAQDGSILNAAGVTDMVWQWGQFLDHDLDETPIADPAEAFDIAVPLGDLWFDPFATGAETIALNRSGYEFEAGVRQQVNLITAFVDASNVYGSDAARARELRTLDGTGRLRTSAGEMLPYNEGGFANAPSNESHYFLAGDVRANEQIGLTAMHTLFMREHNYWADAIARRGVQGGDRIYLYARAIVAAEIQAITYREFLPVLLGPDALREYRGYRPDVDPRIANEFASAAYRFGHTMLSAQMRRVMADGSTHELGDLALAQAFFAPHEVVATGIAPILRGLCAQQAQEIDPFLIDDVRNFLFGPPGAGGFDLASLNIQRGRDHGLPSYVNLRAAIRQDRVRDFRDITRNREIRDRLAQAYGQVELVDAWVGLLSEDHAPGALVGPTLREILVDQFTRSRDGDRFWYQGYLPRELVDVVEAQTLARIMRRNTGIGREISNDVWHVR